jgi:hypothetical protein
MKGFVIIEQDFHVLPNIGEKKLRITDLQEDKHLSSRKSVIRNP